jgi:hypothetical protein
MATKKPSTPSEASDDVSHFSIELGPHELTDAEISNLGNEITKSIVNAVQKSPSVTKKKKGEPYVKVLYVKLIHAKTIRQ